MTVTRSLSKEKISSKLLLMLSLFGLCGSLYFAFGLSEDVISEDVSIDDSHLSFRDCFNRSEDRDNLLVNKAKVVFIVIDAWKYSFLSRPSSPMKFLRENIRVGRAALFRAQAHSPTVTMPRLKSLACGIVPSFSNAVYNFFSSATATDSWIEQAAIRNKKLVFYGDDTWIRLFGSHFTESYGVDSFYVKDYTDVDNNVTSRMESKLSEDFDLMVLHYLGLDHIGHYLGGTSPMIDVKLAEMDSIIEKLYTELEKQGPTVVFIVGDHGMTEQGSHGGASEDEMFVPVVVLHSRVNIHKGLDLSTEKSPDVLQVDVSPTVSEFLGVDHPKQSKGVSLIPVMKRYWNLEEITVASAIDTQLRHFGRFNIKDTSFGSDDDVEYCMKVKQHVSKESEEILKWLQHLQEPLVEASDERWESMTYYGLVTSSLVLFLLVVYFWQTTVATLSKDHLPTLILVVFVYISVFSSSLIEEEHDMWNYFTSTSILLQLFIDMFNKSKNKQVNNNSKQLVVVLFIHRLASSIGQQNRRRWRPDLTPTLPEDYFNDFTIVQSSLRIIENFLFSFKSRIEISVLYSMISILTFSIWIFSNCKHWRQKVLIGVFVVLMIVRNVGYLYGFDPEASISIYLLFTCLLLLTVDFPLAAGVFYLFHLVKVENHLLLALIFCLGHQSRKSSLKPICLYFLCYASLFHKGSTNSLSSIDVARGYYAIGSSFMPIVGFQIVANLYASPLMFIAGYLSCQQQQQSNVLLTAMILRIVFSHAAMLAMIVFSSHLFVYSVFAPKLLFEIFHSCLFSLPVVIYSAFLQIKDNV